MMILVNLFIMPSFIIAFQKTSALIKQSKFTYRHRHDLFPYWSYRVSVLFLNKRHLNELSFQDLQTFVLVTSDTIISSSSGSIYLLRSEVILCEFRQNIFFKSKVNLSEIQNTITGRNRTYFTNFICDIRGMLFFSVLLKSLFQ